MFIRPVTTGQVMVPLQAVTMTVCGGEVITLVTAATSTLEINPMQTTVKKIEKATLEAFFVIDTSATSTVAACGVGLVYGLYSDAALTTPLDHA